MHHTVHEHCRYSAPLLGRQSTTGKAQCVCRVRHADDRGLAGAGLEQAAMHQHACMHSCNCSARPSRGDTTHNCAHTHASTHACTHPYTHAYTHMVRHVLNVAWHAHSFLPGCAVQQRAPFLPPAAKAAAHTRAASCSGSRRHTGSAKAVSRPKRTMMQIN